MAQGACGAHDAEKYVRDAQNQAKVRITWSIIKSQSVRSSPEVGMGMIVGAGAGRGVEVGVREVGARARVRE